MNEIPPEVSKLDSWFGDALCYWQPHEKYREMRKLAIQLEQQNIDLRIALKEVEFYDGPGFPRGTCAHIAQKALECLEASK